MRSAPPDITPVHYKGIELHAEPADEHGTIIAKDIKSFKILWKQEIYNYPLNPQVEPDAQWVFVLHMYIEDDSLIIINERGDQFSLNLKSFTVDKINLPKWCSDISKFEKSFNFDSDKDWLETSSLIEKCSAHFSNTDSKFLSLDLFKKIIIWKLSKQQNRTERHRDSITEDMVTKITSCCFSFYHENPKIEVLTKLRILQALPGVGIGVASAILTICFPDDYAIVDYRVWQVLYNEEKRIFTHSDYLKYYFDIWSCARKLEMEMQKLDFLTWKYWENLK